MWLIKPCHSLIRYDDTHNCYLSAVLEKWSFSHRPRCCADVANMSFVQVPLMMLSTLLVRRFTVTWRQHRKVSSTCKTRVKKICHKSTSENWTLSLLVSLCCSAVGFSVSMFWWQQIILFFPSLCLMCLPVFALNHNFSESICQHYLKIFVWPDCSAKLLFVVCFML